MCYVFSYLNWNKLHAQTFVKKLPEAVASKMYMQKLFFQKFRKNQKTECGFQLNCGLRLQLE